MSYLIKDKVIDGFSAVSEEPLIYVASTEEFITLKVGATYKVIWDNVEYTCTAIDTSAYGNPGDVALGDVAYAFGGESTGEPFAIGNGEAYIDGVAQGAYGNTWCSKVANSSHTVSIILNCDLEETDSLVEEEAIVKNYKLEGFSLGEGELASLGIYGRFTTTIVPLELGKVYTVIWDGVEYSTPAVDASSVTGTAGDIAIGNIGFLTGQSTGEPFAIGYNSAAQTYENVFYSLTDEESHTFSVTKTPYVINNGVIEGFVLADEDPLMFFAQTNPCAVLVNKKVYAVAWDDAKYFCKATTYTNGDASGVVIGDYSYFLEGEETMAAPFATGYGLVDAEQGAYANAWYSKTRAVSHAVTIAETTYLLKEQLIEGFTDQNDGFYGTLSLGILPLVEGQMYSVTWDGADYVATATRISGETGTGLFLGNESLAGYTEVEDTGEPFVIAYVESDDINTWGTTLEGTSHTVTVNLYTAPEEPEQPEEPTEQEGIVLKDRNGNDVAYYGIETVTFDTTTEGKQQTYSKGVVVEGVEVTLALADGDQVIQAADGYLVKEATIKKPETLLPENIAEGVEIAGVTGTFEGNLLEDVPIELNLSAGDQRIQVADGYGVKSAIIVKPETLVPENIAKDVEVAGIIGTMDGLTDDTVIFTAGDYAYKNGGYSSSKISVTAKFDIPSTAVGHSYYVGHGAGESLYDGYKYPSFSYWGLATPTIASGDLYNTVSFTRSYTPTSSSYDYGIHVLLTGAFILPGVSIVENSSGEKVLKADSSVLAWPSKVSFQRCKNIDLSESGITFIPEKGFYKQTSLTNISFPPNIKSIGAYAFNGCSSLNDFILEIPTVEGEEGFIGEYAFYDVSLSKVTLGDHIKTINNDAFACEEDDYNPIEINLGNGVEEIQSYAFGRRRRITGLTLPNSLKTLAEYAFRYSGITEVVVPENVSMDKNVFYYCVSLKTAVLPESLTIIPYGTFYNCYSLTDVTISSKATTINSNAFYNCRFKSMTLPETITEIGQSAFKSNTALTTITIPSKVTALQSSLFDGCSKLESVSLPEGLKTIGSYAFRACSSLQSISIPNSVTTIYTYAFYNCTSLTEITIPSGVTALNNYLFYGCSALPSLAIPSGVTTIGTYVFYGCTSLTSITIPSGVKSIGTYAFYNCSALTNVDLSAVTQVPTLSANNFNSKPDGFTITVPASLYDSFIAATNWKTLADYIVAAS